MSSTQNYFIDINSQFRDTDKYPNPCDFALTFKTNPATGTFSYGVPTSNENFYTNCSIDPDFDSVNVQILNSIIDNLKKTSDDITFICGHTIVGKTPTIVTPTETIVFPSTVYTGSNGFFVCKFSNGNNYKFDWGVYSDINESLPSNTINSTSSCHFQFDFSNNLVIEFDFNASIIDCINIDSSSIKKRILTMSNPNTSNSVVQAIIKLDQQGSLGQYSGRSWGYHIMSSNVDLIPTIENGNLGLSTDPSSNLYVISNTNPTSLAPYYFSSPYQTGSSGELVTTFNTTLFFTPYGSFQKIYNNEAIFMVQTNNGWSPSVNGNNTGAISFYKNTSTGGLVPLGSQYLNHSLPSSQTSVLDFMFIECNNKLYGIQADTYRFNSAAGMTGYIYEINYTGGYSATLVGSTTNPIGYSVSAESVGTKLYIGAWWWITKRFYVWEFDTVTNTTTLKNNVLLPVTSSLVRHLRVRSWNNGTNVYFTAYETNSATSTLLGDMKCFICEYNIGTTSLTITGFFPIFSIGSRDVIVYKIGLKTYVFAYTVGYSRLIIADVTDPYSITYFYYDSKSSGTIATFNIVSGATTSHFLVVTDASNNSFIYDITDIDNQNITYLTSRTWISNPLYSNINVVTYIDDDKVIYVTGRTQTSPDATFNFYKYQSNFTPTTFISTHYSNNLGLYLSTGTNGDCFCFMQDNNDAYTIVPGLNNINFIKTNAVDTSYFSYNYTYSFGVNPRMIESIYYKDYQYLFVGLRNSCNIFRCQDTLYNSIDLTTLSLINNENVYALSGTGSYIGQIFPIIYDTGLYVIFTSINNTLKSYKLNEELSTFELEGSLTYTSFINFNGGFTKYYPSYNQTVLTTFTSDYFVPKPIGSAGNTLYSYSGYINNIDITDPSNMTYVNRTYSSIIPQTPKSLSTFTFNNNFYCALKYDASFSVNLQCYISVYLFNDYLNFSSVSDSGTTNPDYSRIDILSSVITSNSCHFIHFANNGTGTNNNDATLTSNDRIVFTPFNSKSTLSDISTSILNNNAIQVKTLYFNNKISIAILQRNNTMYFYDVTSPEFAATNQNLTTITHVNTGSINFGSAFISKIDQDGTPSYSSYLGSTVSPFVLAQDINLSNTAIDKTGKFLYVSGSWNNAIQFLNPGLYGTTGTYSLSTKLIKEGFTNNGFLLQMNTVDGSCNWIIPILGENIDLIYKIQYGSKDDSLYVCGSSSSSSCFIYSKHSGTSSNFPTTIQNIFNTTSFGSGFIIQFNSNGIYLFRDIIYTNEPLNNVNITDLYVDTERLVVVGTTNASTIECIDSTSTNIQTLYSSITPNDEKNIITYTFNLSGVYNSSNIIKSPTSIVEANDVKLYKSYNDFIITPSFVSNLDDGIIRIYNKDNSIAKTININDTYSYIGLIINYNYDSTYTETSGNKYSKIKWVNPTPFLFEDNIYQNYKLFIQGDSTDSYLNKNFSVRNNYIEPSQTGVYTFILNEFIDVSKINRNLININELTGSNEYYHSSLSSSELSSIIYTIGINTGTNTFIADNITPPLDISKTYYLLFPTSTGTQKVIIKNISYDLTYTYIQVNNINDCIVNGKVIGPYIYVGELNPSVYYNLQFYPASLNYPVYFQLTILSITIPNRPLINLSNTYGGQRTINDLPFIYVSIYNENDRGEYDDKLVNIVYSNSILSVKPNPQYQIPVSNQASTNNFATFTTSLTPTVKFSPGFYNIRIRIMDHFGNILVFDPSATKTNDLTFTNGTVPDYLMNVYLRLSAKKLA